VQDADETGLPDAPSTPSMNTLPSPSTLGMNTLPQPSTLSMKTLPKPSTFSMNQGSGGGAGVQDADDALDMDHNPYSYTLNARPTSTLKP